MIFASYQHSASNFKKNFDHLNIFSQNYMIEKKKYWEIGPNNCHMSQSAQMMTIWPKCTLFLLKSRKWNVYISFATKITITTEDIGGFQLLDLIIPELKSHVIPYKFKSSHWLKLQHSDWRANLVKDFFLQMNFPPMRPLEFIRDHMTFKLRYNQI